MPHARGSRDLTPPLSHRLHRVLDQIHQHLSQLFGVDAHGSHLVLQVELQARLLIARWLQNLNRPSYHAVDVHRGGVAFVGSSVVQHGADDAVQSVDFFDDDVQEVLGGSGPFEAVRGIYEQLGGTLDRSERVLDLVGEARRHLAEDRQPVSFLQACVGSAVFHHHVDHRRQSFQQQDFVGAERIANAVVLDHQQPDDVARARSNAEDDAAVRDGADELGCRQHGLPFRHRTAPLKVVGSGGVIDDHRCGFAQADEQRTGGGGFDPGGGARAEALAHRELSTVGIEQVQGGGGGATAVLERADDGLAHLVELEDVHELLFGGLDHLFELVALSEEDDVDLFLDLVPKGLEQHEDGDGCEHGVQVHRVEADVGDEHIEDAGEAERQGGGDHESADHFVQVDEALALHGFGQGEEEDDGEHGADGRDAGADEPHEVADAEEEGERTYEHEQANAFSHGA